MNIYSFTLKVVKISFKISEVKQKIRYNQHYRPEERDNIKYFL